MVATDRRRSALPVQQRTIDASDSIGASCSVAFGARRYRLACRTYESNANAQCDSCIFRSIHYAASGGEGASNRAGDLVDKKYLAGALGGIAALLVVKYLVIGLIEWDSLFHPGRTEPSNSHFLYGLLFPAPAGPQPVS